VNFFAINTFPTSKFVEDDHRTSPTDVVLKMSNFFDTAAKSQKEHHPGREPTLLDLHSDTLPLRHTFLHILKAQAEI
jgi:hypothetical protein